MGHKATQIGPNPQSKIPIRTDLKWIVVWLNGRHFQNSIRPSNAIMRGELSPPNPTPSSPVGGEIVLSKVPNLGGMYSPGTPASTLPGSVKLGWLKALNNCTSKRNEAPSRSGNLRER